MIVCGIKLKCAGAFRVTDIETVSIRMTGQGAVYVLLLRCLPKKLRNWGFDNWKS